MFVSRFSAIQEIVKVTKTSDLGAKTRSSSAVHLTLVGEPSGRVNNATRSVDACRA